MSPETTNPKILDLNLLERGVWLVKVPKYISKRWQKSSSSKPIGTLEISRLNPGKPKVSVNLSDHIVSMEMDTTDKISKEYELFSSNMTNQTLTVFSHKNNNEKINLQGQIAKRFDLKPKMTDTYLQMKMENIKKACEPKKKTVLLAKTVNNFTPNWKKLNYADDKQKHETKMVRQDTDIVQGMLFKLFEKHQFYRIQDLVRLTQQPITHVKEIMREIGDFNLKYPNKNMWQLKEEYRHYS